MPQGVMDLFTGFHSGMDAIPGRLGSNVREKGRVDGLASGVKEAGKGLVYGWWDGITGLVTEPIEGGKKEVRFFLCSLSKWRRPLTSGSLGCAEGDGKEL